MSDYLFLVTPLGRLTRGSLTERAKTDYDGNPYADGEGPFELGLAIRKDDPATGEFLGKLYQKAVADAPNLKPKIDAEWQSGFTAGAFRFKVRDGDKPNQKGQINQNTVGHYVLNLSTSLPIKFTYTDQYGLKLTDVMGQAIPARTEITPDKIKIGDFAHVAISTKYNGKFDHTAGLYLSQSAVMLAGYGEAISGGLSIDEAFAAVPTGALPAGASVTSVGNGVPGVVGSPPISGQPLPTGSANGAVPSPSNPLPGAAPATPPAPAPVPGGAPTLPTASPTSAPVQPHTQFLQNAPVGLPLPGQQ